MKVDFYRHDLGAAEAGALTDTLQGVFLTTGPRTAEFEKRFSAMYNAPFGVGVTSWTMGNFITLKAIGIGPGDEVITTPLTFVATANTVLQCGAKLVLVDVDPATGNMDLNALAKAITLKTKAILPVHLYGQMCDMQAIVGLANQYGIAVIEDCAHCVEGEYNGIKPGELSTAAIFSFYATKNLTCGEGGAIITKNKDLYEKLLVYRLHGMNKSAADRYQGQYRHWDMEELGWKCNMNDLQAAMLLPQLNRLKVNLQRREKIAQTYYDGLAGIAGLTWPAVLPNSRHARHLFTIWVDPDLRDVILLALQERGVGVAVNFRAVHLLSYYQKNLGYQRGEYPVAENIGDRTITLPFYPTLREDEIKYVIEQVRAVVSGDLVKKTA